MCETRDLGIKWTHWHTLVFNSEITIDMRFVCPKDIRKMLVQRARSVHWKKWAAKHEDEELIDGAWLEPGLALLRKKAKENWTEKHRTVARKIFLEGGWTQKRLFDAGWSDVRQCQACQRKAQRSTGSSTAQSGTKSDWRFQRPSQSCFQNNLFFALDFSQVPSWNCLELSPFFVHGSLCIRNLHGLWHRDKLKQQNVMCHRGESFSSNALFMCFGLQRFCSLSRRVVGFHHTTIQSFELFFIANLRHCIRFHPLAGHGWCHRSFQFLPCVFLIISEYSFVIRIDKLNPSQLSRVVTLRFLFWPIPAFLDSERIYLFSSKILARHNLVL